MIDDSKGPGVKFPPPMIFILFMAVAYLLSLYIPVGLGGNGYLPYLGLASTVCGFLLIFSAVYSFKRAQTALKPWKPTSHLVQSGIFAYSRNPIYLAFCFISVGTGLMLNTLWITLSTIPSVIILFFIAIRPEENYLEAKFGEEYRLYKANVGRWF